MSNWYAHNLVYAEGWQAADLTSSGSGSKALFAQVTIASLPVVQDAKLQQEYAFSGQAVASKAPQVVVTGLREENALTPGSIAAGETVVGSPVLQQTSDSIPADVAAGSPAIAASTLEQGQALAPDPMLSNIPTVGAPSSVVTVHVSAGSVPVSSFVQAAQITQTHGLGAPGLVADNPAVGTPALGLQADNVLSGKGFVGPAALRQKLDLKPANISAAPTTVGRPAVTEIPTVGVEDLQLVLFVSAPLLEQRHLLSPVLVTSPSVEVGTPPPNGRSQLNPGGVLGAPPNLEPPVVTVNHWFNPKSVENHPPLVEIATIGVSVMGGATGVVTRPAIGAPSWIQSHKLLTSGVSTSPPGVNQTGFVSSLHAEPVGAGPNSITLTESRNEVIISYSKNEAA